MTVESNEKVCPRCAETVKAAAQVCRYCGHEFQSQKSAHQSATPALDLVEMARHGEAVLRTCLADLSTEELHKIIADYEMDPSRRALRWTKADLIELIVKTDRKIRTSSNPTLAQATTTVQPPASVSIVPPKPNRPFLIGSAIIGALILLGVVGEISRPSTNTTAANTSDATTTAPQQAEATVKEVSSDCRVNGSGGLPPGVES
jgi:ribosomal protein L40E